MAVNEKVTNIYNLLKQNGDTNAKDVNEFSQRMSGNAYRQQIYGFLKKQGVKGIGSGYGEFTKLTGYETQPKTAKPAAKQQGTVAKSTQQAQSVGQQMFGGGSQQPKTAVTPQWQEPQPKAEETWGKYSGDYSQPMDLTKPKKGAQMPNLVEQMRANDKKVDAVLDDANLAKKTREDVSPMKPAMTRLEQRNKAEQMAKGYVAGAGLDKKVDEAFKESAKATNIANQEIVQKNLKDDFLDAFRSLGIGAQQNEARKINDPAAFVEKIKGTFDNYIVQNADKIAKEAEQLEMPVEQYAMQYVKPALESALHDAHVDKYLPKNDLEYIVGGMDSWATSMANRLSSESSGTFSAKEEAAQKYGEQAGWGTRMARGAVDFADPSFGAAFKAGGAVGKGIAKVTGLTMLAEKGASKMFQKSAEYAAKFGSRAGSRMDALLAQATAKGFGKHYLTTLPGEIIGQGLGMNAYGALQGGVSTLGSTGDLKQAGETAWEALTDKKGFASGAAFATFMPLLHQGWNLMGAGYKKGASMMNKAGWIGARAGYEAGSILGTAAVMHLGHNLGAELSGENVDWGWKATVNGTMEETAVAAAMKFNPHLIGAIKNARMTGKWFGSEGGMFTKAERDEICKATGAKDLNDALLMIFPDGKASGTVTAEEVAQAQTKFLQVMNGLSWDAQNKLAVALTGSFTVQRPRTASFSFNGNDVVEHDKDGNVLSVSTFKTADERMAYIAEKQMQTRNADFFDVYGTALDKNGAMVEGYLTEELKAAMDKEPVRRTAKDWEVMKAAEDVLKEIAYPENEVHIEFSMNEGARVAEDAQVVTDNPDVSKIAELNAQVDAAQEELAQTYKDYEWAEDYEELKGQGLSDKDAYAQLLDMYNEADLEPLAKAINAQGKQDGFMEGVQNQIETEVSEQANKATNGKKVVNGEEIADVVQLTDAERNVYTMLEGDINLDGTMGESEQPIIVMDRDGEPHRMDASEFTGVNVIGAEDFANEKREELGVKATNVIDPEGKMNPNAEDSLAKNGEEVQKPAEETKEPLKKAEGTVAETQEPVEGKKPNNNSVIEMDGKPYIVTQNFKWKDGKKGFLAVDAEGNEQWFPQQSEYNEASGEGIDFDTARISASFRETYGGDKTIDEIKAQSGRLVSVVKPGQDKFDTATSHMNALIISKLAERANNYADFFDSLTSQGFQITSAQEGQIIGYLFGKLKRGEITLDEFRSAFDPISEVPKTTEGGIPLDENGEPMLTADGVKASQAVDEVYNRSGLSKEEADAYVDDMVKESKANYERISKKQPKLKGSLKERAEAKRQYEEDLDKAKKDADRWQEIYEEAHKFDIEEVKEPEISDAEFAKVMEGFEDDPTMIILANMPKITPEAYYKETGLSGKDRPAFWLASKAKGGKSVDEAVISLRELFENNANVSEDFIRETVIDAIKNGGPRSWAKRIREDYEDAMRAGMERDEQRQKDEWAMERFGMTYDEWESYEQDAVERIAEKYRGVDMDAVAQAHAEVWEEITKNEIDNGREDTRTDRGNEVLHGERTGDEGRTGEGTESGGEVPARAEMQGANGEASGNGAVASPDLSKGEELGNAVKGEDAITKAESAENPYYKPKSEREKLVGERAQLEENIKKFDETINSDDMFDNANKDWARGSKEMTEKRIAEIDSRLKELDDAEANASGTVARKRQPSTAVEAKGTKVEGNGKDWGAKNKVITTDAKNELLARLKKKMSQANEGVDPELLEIGTKLAMYHIEAGAHKFADYVKAIVRDLREAGLGEQIEKLKGEFKSWYAAASVRDEFDDISDNFDERKAIKASNVDELIKELDNVEPKKIKENEDVQLQNGSAEGRSAGHEHNENTSLGGSERNEDVRTERDGMDRRDTTHSVSDVSGSARVHGSSDGKEGDNGELTTNHSGEETEAASGTAVKNSRNYRAGYDDVQKEHVNNNDYSHKTPDARVKANIEAIKVMKELEETGATATKEQMDKMARFSGWGGLGVESHKDEIVAAIGEDAYKEAALGAFTSYYTPSEVINTMWGIAEKLGFKGGRILEGSAGIGNILALMPGHISGRSDIHAVELDSTTGGLLKHLYPDAKVDVQGFEATHVDNGSVDLAITNVPFSTQIKAPYDKTGDKDLSRRFKYIHDFCIAKNVRKLKEGGLGIFISSSGTLDNSTELRKWLVNEGKADVIGAFRMHDETFGGTGATSDIIVVRKRVNGEVSPNAIDVSHVVGTRSIEIPTDRKDKKGNEIWQTKPITINKYFAEHPENMGGEMKLGYEVGDTFRPGSQRLVNDGSQEKKMREWLKSIKTEANTSRTEAKAETIEERVAKINEKLGAGVREGSMLVNKNGELCVARRGEAVPLEGKSLSQKVKGKYTKQEVFKDYSDVKNALQELLDYQMNNEGDEGLGNLMAKLNRMYDRFVTKYGQISGSRSLSFLKNDADFANIMGLENTRTEMGKDGKKKIIVSKGDIFSKRVIQKDSEPQPKNEKDGVIASIYKYGKVDTKFIAEKLGKSEEEVKKTILDEGLGFEDPTNGDTVVNFEYLSGNVREKLELAKENNVDGKFDKNIKELEKVIPMDIPAHLIEFNIGSNWVDKKLFQDFIKEKTGVKTDLANIGGSWSMDQTAHEQTLGNRNYGVYSEQFDEYIPGTKLIEAAMRNTTISVSHTQKHYDGTTETITDKNATQACTTKIGEIRAEFREWAHDKMRSDHDLAEKIAKVYNDKFNNYVAREIPDQFVPEHFGGATKNITLRPHQAKAAIRATMEPVLLAHEVGTGKTFTQITTAMEMRRLGTAKKPMIVVQNATTGQFVESAKALYPGAKILTIDDTSKGEQGRKDFYAKIRYNDWDMIIVPQSVLDRMPDSYERQMQYIAEKIDEKMHVLESMGEDKSNNYAVRGAKKEIEDLESELAELTAKKSEKDDKRKAKATQNISAKMEELLDRDIDEVEDFDEMGIDAIIVDEAHEYKHLGFATAMQRGVKGVDPSPSKKSQGLFLKCQSVLEKSGGKNVVFATGTPISNTAAETWTFMRYLMPKAKMEEAGIYYFDDFVRNFGNIAQMLEFTTSGNFRENTRFAGYVNLPELVRLWSGVADTVLSKDQPAVIKSLPETIEGWSGDMKPKATQAVLPQSKQLRSVMSWVRKQLADYEAMSGKEKKENSHIPLVMYGVAAKAAIDVRLVLNDKSIDVPDSKVNQSVKNILADLEESKDYKGTTALFCDSYQNKNSGFNVYQEVKRKLVEAGIPEEQIYIMKSGMTPKAKAAVFEKVNAGDIRVIMGSTQTLGVGVNIQERLMSMHNLDVPNRPMDYTQRVGRLVRQGNLHKVWGKKVKIWNYAVEDSLDITGYQRLQTKGNIADSIMDGGKLMSNNQENRVVEEEEDSFGDVVANLSGSQYALLKQKAERDLRKFENKKKQWESDQVYIHNNMPRLEGQKREGEKRIEENQKHLATIESRVKDGKVQKITIGKKEFGGIDGMEEFLKEQNKKQNDAMVEIRKQAEGGLVQQSNSKLEVDVDGFKFTMQTTIKGELGIGKEGAKATRKMTYSCEELGLEDVPVKGGYLKNALEDITTNVLTGKDNREFIENAQDSIKRIDKELEALRAREGKPFEFESELADASKKVEEYTEEMRKEMEEKEKKYAEMDAEAEDVNLEDMDLSDGGEEEGEVRASEELEDENEKRLPSENSQDLTTYGATQTKADAKVQYNSEERKNIKLKLANLSTKYKNVKNPRGFISDIVTSLGITKTEGASKYREFDLNDGRTMTVRVSNHNTQAHTYAEEGNTSDKTLSIVIKSKRSKNTFEAGREIIDEYVYFKEDIRKADGNVLSEIADGVNKALDSGIYIDKTGLAKKNVSPETRRMLSETLEGGTAANSAGTVTTAEIEKHVEKVGKGAQMHSDVTDVPKRFQKSAKAGRLKGWWDEKTNSVHLYMPNIKSKYEAEKAIVHETVGHKGMRGLLNTAENPNGYHKYMDMLWADKSNAALHEFVKKYAPSHKWDIYEAIDEWIAREAEKDVTPENLSMWGKIKRAFTDAIRKAGYMWNPNIADVRYALWLSKRGGGNSPLDPLWRARKAAMQEKIMNADYRPVTKDGVYVVNDTLRYDNDSNGDVRASEDLTPMGKAVRDHIDEVLRSSSFKRREALVDNMESLRVAQEAIGGKNVKDGENAYLAENHMSSIAEAQWNKFKVQKYQKLEDAINKCVGLIGGNSKQALQEVEKYAYQKHGLERNIYMYVKDAVEKYAKSKEGKEAEENYKYMMKESLSPDDMADMDRGNIETADKMWSKFMDEKARLMAEYRKGEISYGDVIRGLDEYIIENIEAEYDPNKVDYSGISEFDGERKIEGKAVEYDRDSIIDSVDNMEGELGKANVDNLWSEVKNATNFAVDYSYESGQADSNGRDGIKGMYDFYVPLRGFAEDKMEDVYDRYQNDGGNGVGKVLKKAGGRTSLADSPFATISSMANTAIIQGERNKMLQKFYRLVTKNENDMVKVSETWETTDPDADVEKWELAMPEITDDMNAKEIADAVDTFNAEMKRRELEGTARKVIGRPEYPAGFKNKLNASKHAVRVYINGREKMMWVTGDPRLAQALRGEIVHKDRAVAPLRWLKDTTAKLATSYSPEFILSNLERDTLFSSANIASKENAAYFGKFTKNQAICAGLMGFSGIGGDKVGESLFEKYYRGREPKSATERLFFEFMDNGGRTGFIAQQQLEQHKKDLAANIKGNTISEKGWEAVKGILGAVPKGIEEMNMRAELVNRFATYMTSRQMGRSKMRSVADAKEVSVNFNRKGAGNATEGKWGSTAGFMRDYYMFFNAGVQSMELLNRNLSKDKTTAFKTSMYMGAIPAMVGTAFAMIMASQDDEQYSNIPSWDRRNNICIPYGDAGYVKIALPIELRAFWGMGDIMASLKHKRLQTEESPEFAMAGQISQMLPLDMLEAGEQRFKKDTWWTPWLPTSIRPMAELLTNTSWTGKPIQKESKFNPDAPQWTLAYSSTNKELVEICKWVHDKTRKGEDTAQETDVTGVDISPAKVEHLLKSYFSGAFSLLGKTANTANNIKDGKVDIAHAPMLSRVFGSFTDREIDATTNAKYWSYKRESDNTYKEFTNNENKTNPLAMTELRNSARGKRTMLFKQAEKDMKAMQKAIDAATDKDVQREYKARMAEYKRQLVDMLDAIE